MDRGYVYCQSKLADLNVTLELGRRVARGREWVLRRDIQPWCRFGSWRATKRPPTAMRGIGAVDWSAVTW